MKKKLEETDLLHISSLAFIKLQDKEKEELLKDLDNILNYFENLKELDTSTVSDNPYLEGLGLHFREDKEGETLKEDKVFLNGPRIEDNFFVVERIVEE